MDIKFKPTNVNKIAICSQIQKKGCTRRGEGEREMERETESHGHIVFSKIGPAAWYVFSERFRDKFFLCEIACVRAVDPDGNFMVTGTKFHRVGFTGHISLQRSGGWYSFGFRYSRSS